VTFTGGTRSFKFENMWLKSKGFVDKNNGENLIFSKALQASF
jgi:hypothetical protein